MTTLDHIEAILLRDLDTLREEIDAYPSIQQIWEIPEGVNNSSGTLVLHLCGNLQHFISATLGGSGYVRDRDSEFSVRGIRAEELIAEIQRTAESVAATCGNLSAHDLSRDYPIELGEKSISTERFLIHLCTHLAFHLGQIDYHRRIVTGNNLSLGPQSIKVL